MHAWRGPGVKEKFQKTLILVIFEVIVQPPKNTFEIEDFFRVLAHYKNNYNY